MSWVHDTGYGPSLDHEGSVTDDVPTTTASAPGCKAETRDAAQARMKHHIVGTVDVSRMEIDSGVATADRQTRQFPPRWFCGCSSQCAITSTSAPAVVDLRAVSPGP